MTLGSSQAIIFDLGKVLIDFSVNRACSQISDLVQAPSKKVHDFLFKDGREFEFERGQISFGQLHRQFEDHFGRTIPADALKFAASDIFDPVPETLAVLESIYKRYRGIHPLILLSNTNEIHWEHIERNWSVSRWFDDLILSFEIKSMKPEKDIYLKAIAKAGRIPTECFFVDDIPENVAGAKSCGIDAVLFEGAEKLIQDLALRGISLK